MKIPVVRCMNIQFSANTTCNSCFFLTLLALSGKMKGGSNVLSVLLKRFYILHLIIKGSNPTNPRERETIKPLASCSKT